MSMIKNTKAAQEVVLLLVHFLCAYIIIHFREYLLLVYVDLSTFRFLMQVRVLEDFFGMLSNVSF